MSATLPIDLRVLEKLRDAEAVRALALDPSNVNPDPISPSSLPWSDLSLSSGYPSLVLLFSALENEEATVHNYVVKIKEAIETEGLFDLSLFGGVAGICFALSQASCQGTRYQRMINTLHTFLLDRVDAICLDPLRKNPRRGLPSSPRLYDPIQGAAGIGRYALENLSNPSLANLSEEIAKAFVGFVRPFIYKDFTIPGWYVSAADVLNARNRSMHPKGNFNLGLAHGVTGVLAYLSIAYSKGVQVEGQKEAIQMLSSWIRSKAFLLNGAVMWPYNILWEEEIEKKEIPKTSSKDAWCYGVPGIARTLFLAGKAIGDNELKTFAASAFSGVFQRRREEWHLPGPALCHGIAGLLLMTREMAKEEICSNLLPQVTMLEEMLLSFYNQEAPWGFQEEEPCRRGGSCFINKLGFLEGSVGILLTLLNPASSPNWHLPLLIHD